MSTTDTAPLRAPVAVGLNVTEIVHVPFGPTDVQLFVCAKSPAFVPVMLTLVMVSVATPLALVSVMVCGALVVPTVCAANVRLFGVNDTAVQIPVSDTV